MFSGHDVQIKRTLIRLAGSSFFINMKIFDNNCHVNAHFCKTWITIKKEQQGHKREYIKAAVILNSYVIMNILYGTYFALYKVCSRQKYVLKIFVVRR